jgi:hypothetical protein
MNSPNYDWGDLVAFVGLLIGLGISWVALPLFGVTHKLALLLVGTFLGAGIGYYIERWFRAQTGLRKRSD